jgi:hypothetical protein
LRVSTEFTDSSTHRAAHPRGRSISMSLHSDDFEDVDDRETRSREPAGFRHRHGLKILGAVMVAMFALVIVTQGAC